MQIPINKDTQLCMSLAARPGNFGTRFHNYLYRELNLNFVYKAFTTKDLPAAIGGIRALGIRGCAISMPFKEECIPHLDALDASAEGIQSVNTIVNDDGRLTGYNTDYSAVFELLKTNAISPDYGFALMGSGGMAKAVLCALKDAGFKKGTVIARNPKTGPALAAQYGYRWAQTLDERPELLINVTPIGMAGGKEEADAAAEPADPALTASVIKDLSFPLDAIQKAQAVFDVVAIPSETPLIQAAQRLNKKFITGAKVIALQAAGQFKLYTGVSPDRALVEKAAAFARD